MFISFQLNESTNNDGGRRRKLRKSIDTAEERWEKFAYSKAWKFHGRHMLCDFSAWTMHGVGGEVYLKNCYTGNIYRSGLTSAPFRIPLWPVSNVSEPLDSSNEIDCGGLMSELRDREFEFGMWFCEFCNTYILSTQCLWLLDKQGSPGDVGISTVSSKSFVTKISVIHSRSWFTISLHIEARNFPNVS